MTYSCGNEKNSDCLVEVLLTGEKRVIDVESKMKVLFGDHIENAVSEVLDEFNVYFGYVKVKDFGALDFVIKARTKTALREALKGGKING